MKGSNSLKIGDNNILECKGIIIHMHRLGLSILAVNWQRVRGVGVRALVEWKLHMKTNHLKVNTV